MSLRAIHNHILFQFIDKISESKGQFEEGTTSNGIVLLSSHDESAKQPRWATIVSLGPDCSEQLRVPGCEVLIENLRWTPGVKYNGETYWRTDETQLLGYRYPNDN